MSNDVHLSLGLAVATGEAKAESESFKTRGFRKLIVGNFAVTAI